MPISFGLQDEQPVPAQPQWRFGDPLPAQAIGAEPLAAVDADFERWRQAQPRQQYHVENGRTIQRPVQIPVDGPVPGSMPLDLGVSTTAPTPLLGMMQPDPSIRGGGGQASLLSPLLRHPNAPPVEVWNGGQMNTSAAPQAVPNGSAIPNWDTDTRNPQNRNGIGAPTPENFGASVVGNTVSWHLPGADRVGYNTALSQHQQEQRANRAQQLQSDIARGTNGHQGTIANAAQESQARYSPAGQLNTFYQQQILAGQAAGISPEETVAGLVAAGFPRPNMLQGMGNGTGGSTGDGTTQLGVVPGTRWRHGVDPLPTPNNGTLPVEVNPNTPAPGAETIPPLSRRIQNALLAAERTVRQPGSGPNRQQASYVPYTGDNVQAIHNAITNYLANFSDPEIANNWSDISAAIQQHPGFGQTAMNGWQQTGLPYWRGMQSAAQNSHSVQRERAVRAQGGSVNQTIFGGVPTLEGAINPRQAQGVGFWNEIRSRFR